MFTAPTAIRAVKKEDPKGLLAKKYDLSKLKAIFLAGERTDPATCEFAEQVGGVVVVDHWWQTETGWPIASNPIGIETMPTKRGSTTFPLPGYRVKILDPEGVEVAAGVEGSIVMKLPLPPGFMSSLWQDPERLVSSYMTRFPGYYDTSDDGYFDSDGYLFVMNRSDDVLNVAGHRLSSGSIEEAVGAHPTVAEVAVIGIKDAFKGQVPVALVVIILLCLLTLILPTLLYLLTLRTLPTQLTLLTLP
jgi:propionyl-CoA synthetase